MGEMPIASRCNKYGGRYSVKWEITNEGVSYHYPHIFLEHTCDVKLASISRMAKNLHPHSLGEKKSSACPLPSRCPISSCGKTHRC